MINLIKLQIRNIFKQKFFYVCLGLIIIMGPLMNFIGVFNTAAYGTIKVLPQITSLLSSEVGLISTIFIALICCLDFSEGTAKNIIARGYSRTQLILSKYIGSLVGLFTFYIITFVVILALFGINGFGYESGLLYLLINSVFRIIAHTIFFSTMSFILEKNGSAIIACLFVPTIIQTVLALIDSKLGFNIGKYWISNVSNKFLENVTLSNLNYSIILYIIYIVLFIAIGINIIKNKEIK